MRFDRSEIRMRRTYKTGLWLVACLLLFLGSSAATQQSAGAQKQTGNSRGSGRLTSEEVVEQLVAMNLRRAQALHSYSGTRTYRVEYKSSLKTLSAEMVVEVNYLAPETKTFKILSSSGSKLIIDRVLRKILQAEEEALSTEAQRRTTLSHENYDFTMVGYESTPSQSLYVLLVEPKTKDKFLFRGRVWVDADDFAVVRIEAEPAKNPSFWTKNNEIEQLYMKVNDFWLPERNHSISSIRLGGRAELTIEYQNYDITEADPVGSASGREISRSADTRHALDRGQIALCSTAETESCLTPASTVNHQNSEVIKNK